MKKKRLFVRIIDTFINIGWAFFIIFGTIFIIIMMKEHGNPGLGNTLFQQFMGIWLLLIVSKMVFEENSSKIKTKIGVKN